MRIELQAAARDQKPVLLRLMELYCYDFTEFLTWPLNADGTFCNPQRFEARWDDARIEKYFVRVEGELAGFVLVHHGSHLSDDSAVRDIDEFFIMRGYRGRGVGRVVAQSTFALHRGPWEVRVLEENTGAQAFWRRVIDEYTNGDWIESRCDDERWCGLVYSFDSNVSQPPKVL